MQCYIEYLNNAQDTKIAEGLINHLAVIEFKDDFLGKMTPELNFKERIDICRVTEDKRENVPG